MCRSSYPGISQAQRGGDWEGSDSEGVSSYSSSTRSRHAGPRRSVDSDLDQGDTFGLEALFAFDNLDLDPLTGVERGDAAAAQSGDVDEHILAAAVGGDESVAFFGFEPFHRTLDRRCRPGSAAIGPAGPAGRRRCGTVVDIQDAGHQRAFRAGGDLAGDRGTFAHILIAGAAQNRHRQERVLRSVVRGDKSKALAGVEPFDLGIDATAWGGVFAKEPGAAFVHGSSKRARECG